MPRLCDAVLAGKCAERMKGCVTYCCVCEEVIQDLVVGKMSGCGVLSWLLSESSTGVVLVFLRLDSWKRHRLISLFIVCAASYSIGAEKMLPLLCL